MESKRFGYIRVSSKEQNIARQIEAMTNYGISERDLFIDKVSGKSFDRPAYNGMLQVLREGDTVVVLSLDRFSRNYKELEEQWRYLTQTLKINIEVIDMPILNTNRHGNIEETFVADLVLQILAYVAEKERLNTRNRQRQGIEMAKKNKTKFGRPSIQVPANFKECYDEWKAGQYTAVQAMKRLDLKPTSFYKLVKQFESEQGKT